MINKKDTVRFEDYLYYDSESPSGLRWKADRANGKIRKDSVAGGKSNRRYFMTSLMGYTYLSHRIVWIMHNGLIPIDRVVDHIDGDCFNNCIENLRVVTISLNSKNQKKYITNTSGATGVYFDAGGAMGRWKAEWVNVDGESSTKSFSVGKYGDDAYLMACSFRQDAIVKMNIVGGGYSERHGI